MTKQELLEDPEFIKADMCTELIMNVDWTFTKVETVDLSISIDKEELILR